MIAVAATYKGGKYHRGGCTRRWWNRTSHWQLDADRCHVHAPGGRGGSGHDRPPALSHGEECHDVDVDCVQDRRESVRGRDIAGVRLRRCKEGAVPVLQYPRSLVPVGLHILVRLCRRISPCFPRAATTVNVVATIRFANDRTTRPEPDTWHRRRMISSPFNCWVVGEATCAEGSDFGASVGRDQESDRLLPNGDYGGGRTGAALSERRLRCSVQTTRAGLAARHASGMREKILAKTKSASCLSPRTG